MKRDKRRSASLVEAGAAETTMEININASAAGTKLETNVAQKKQSSRNRAFRIFAFIIAVLLAWFAMRPQQGGAAFFAGSARCGGLGSSVAKVAGSDVDSEIGLSDYGAWSFVASDVSVGGAGLLATGSRSGFGLSFAGDEGAPLGVGCCISDALCFYGDTARPPENPALWPRDYISNTGSTWCTDVVVQYNLGVRFTKGRGPAQSGAETARWFGKEAGQGLAQAQTNLEPMLTQGRGMAQSDVEAAHWLRKAAGQRHAKAQLNLGAMLAKGCGVTQSDEEAASRFRKAAGQGLAEAQ
jgi:hypothetical protein